MGIYFSGDARRRLIIVAVPIRYHADKDYLQCSICRKEKVQDAVV